MDASSWVAIVAIVVGGVTPIVIAWIKIKNEELKADREEKEGNKERIIDCTLDFLKYQSYFLMSTYLTKQGKIPGLLKVKLKQLLL